MSDVTGLLPVQPLAPLAGSVSAASRPYQTFLSSSGGTQIPLQDIQQRISQRVEWWTETVRYLQERIAERIDTYVSFIDESASIDAGAPDGTLSQVHIPQSHINQVA